MNTRHLICGAVTIAIAIALTGCQRPATQADVKQTARSAAADIKAEAQNAASTAGEHLSDGWLTTKIQSKFVGDRDIDAADISVSSHDGVVTLKGRVLNDPMRSLAVAIAKNTDGVRQVIDQLSVTIAPPVPPARAQIASSSPGAVATTGTVDETNSRPGYTDDPRITSSIQAKFFLDDKLKGRPINVQTSNGVVTLNGVLGDEVERGEALLLTRTTEGVRRVEDNLTVAAASPAPLAAAPDTDSALATRVQSQLASDAQVKRATIDVTAKEGVVLLQGTVPSTAAKQHALNLARTTDGVTQVVDRLRVGVRKK